MSLVTEILTADQLNDLWRSGFTIVRRKGDPYEIDPKLIPHGMSYQWNSVIPGEPGEIRPDGWRPVPFSRHEGVFAPWGTPGDIHIGALVLGEKPKAGVQAELKAGEAKAHKLVDDWIEKHGGVLSGHVQIGDTKREVGTDKQVKEATGTFERVETKTIESTVKIPRDMQDHILEILNERDRLEREVVRKDRTLVPGEIADKFYEAIQIDDGLPWWPTLRAILLPIAVDNVRAKLKKEAPND